MERVAHAHGLVAAFGHRAVHVEETGGPHTAIGVGEAALRGLIAGDVDPVAIAREAARCPTGGAVAGGDAESRALATGVDRGAAAADLFVILAARDEHQPERCGDTAAMGSS